MAHWKMQREQWQGVWLYDHAKKAADHKETKGEIQKEMEKYRNGRCKVCNKTRFTLQ